MMYDLKLGKSHGADKVFNGVYGVFNTPLNTSDGCEAVNSIQNSDDKNTGVNVFIENTGEENNNFSDGEDLAAELYEIMNGDNGNGKKDITPFICRKGCKYYDGIKDVNDGEFKEFCDMTGRRISGKNSCVLIEPKGIKLPDGVLAV
jgi:hypothetical protein